MGSQCMPEQRRFQKIDNFCQPEGWEEFHRADPKHSRFGNIQKIRTKHNEVYKLIMATNDARMQAISIQCRILQSTAQFQLYDGTSFDLLDHLLSPIIDLFDSSDMQVYHPIKTQSRSKLSVKLYPFSGYTDSILKRGVYQIHLYNEMRSMSPLLDFFIMTKGKLSTLVMIFKNYQVSLHDIIVYRQSVKYPWSEQQLLLLWKMIISNYKVMHQLGISHRDIRPSKIFYTSQSKNTPFQFVNLATARLLTKAEADNDLLTVIGVDQFVQGQLKDRIRKGDNLASYNSFKADRKALQNLFYSTLNLDALWKKDKSCTNQTLDSIIKLIKDDSNDFQSIENKIQNTIKTKKYDKQELFSVDRIISEDLIKLELRRINKERIEESHLYALIRLHKREALNKWIIQKLQQNQANGMKYDNIVLMHKVAEYFQSLGIQKNDYFVEEFSLLLELAKQCRLQEYFNDHQQHLKHLTNLLPKIPKQSNDLFIAYYNELTLSYLYQNKKDLANQHLNKLLQQSQRYNDLNVSLQLEVLITKVNLEILNKKYDTAENTIQKIGLIIATGDFSSFYDSKFFQAQFQYLKTYYSLELMMANREEIKPRRISSSERSITNSIFLYTNLPISNQNMAKIINAHLIHSDLLAIKEVYAESKKSLQSAETLMSQLQKTRSLSDNLKMKFLMRLKKVLEKFNKANQPVYKTTIDKIRKIQDKFQKSNADRHRKSKELRDKQKNKAKRQNRLIKQQAIIEENEDEDF